MARNDQTSLRREARTRDVIGALARNTDNSTVLKLADKVAESVGDHRSADVYAALITVLAALASHSSDPEAFCWAIGELAAQAASPARVTPDVISH